MHRPGNLRQGERITARPNHDIRQPANIPDVTSEHISLESGAASLTIDDPPPKYTPPPSYTAVTGSRIAKMLRNSIRRSVRRLVDSKSVASFCHFLHFPFSFVPQYNGRAKQQLQ